MKQPEEFCIFGLVRFNELTVWIYGYRENRLSILHLS
jgi:hypothetical protein